MRVIKFILLVMAVGALFASASPASAAITLVQKAKSPPQVATDSARTSSAAAYPNPPAAGNLLIAIIASDAGSLTAPAGWSTAINQASTVINTTTLVPAQAIFYRIAGAAEPQTVTSPENRSIEIFEYSGIEQANQLLAVSSSSGQGSLLNSGTVAPTAPALLIVGFAGRPVLADPLLRGSGNGLLGAYTNSFTEQENISAGEVPCNDIDPACYAFSSGTRIASVTGSYSTAATFTAERPGTAGWRGQIAAFRAAQILLTNAVSRKIHGATTPFDINLPLSGEPGVECRIGGATNDYQVVFTFPSSVTFTSASVTAGTGSVSSSSGSGTATVTVNLTGVTSAQRITLTLSNVNNGTTTGDVGIQMGVLVGDTNADTFVNAGDALQTRNRSGQATDTTNFRSDVNTDGFVNSGDTLAIRSRSGTSLP